MWNILYKIYNLTEDMNKYYRFAILLSSFIFFAVLYLAALCIFVLLNLYIISITPLWMSIPLFAIILIIYAIIFDWFTRAVENRL